MNEEIKQALGIIEQGLNLAIGNKQQHMMWQQALGIIKVKLDPEEESDKKDDKRN